MGHDHFVNSTMDKITFKWQRQWHVTLPFLKIDMRHYDPPPFPSRAPCRAEKPRLSRARVWDPLLQTAPSHASNVMDSTSGPRPKPCRRRRENATLPTPWPNKPYYLLELTRLIGKVHHGGMNRRSYLNGMGAVTPGREKGKIPSEQGRIRLCRGIAHEVLNSNAFFLLFKLIHVYYREATWKATLTDHQNPPYRHA